MLKVKIQLSIDRRDTGELKLLLHASYNLPPGKTVVIEHVALATGHTNNINCFCTEVRMIMHNRKRLISAARIAIKSSLKDKEVSNDETSLQDLINEIGEFNKTGIEFIFETEGE